MSRIEEALEKAAQMRSGKRDVTASVKAVSPSTPAAHTQYTLPEGATAALHSPMLVTATDPHSPVAEEYRKLKSLIVSLTRQDEFRNALMVTSSLAGEGKSVTSLNLAISLAQEFDHTVLLIDADLRKPSLHQYFGIDAKVGLADCLRDGIDPGDVLIKTGIGKLTLLPAGRPVRNPVELMSSQRMADLLQEMKHRYPDRYIIIDTPPILLFAETLSLSYLVDGVIFLVKEGLATVQNITDSLSNLKGTPVLGMVYNNVSQESLESRYYYYYGDRASEQGPEKKGFLRRMFGN